MGWLKYDWGGTDWFYFYIFQKPELVSELVTE